MLELMTNKVKAFKVAQKIERAIFKTPRTTSHTLESSKYVPYSDAETIENLSEKLKKKANSQ